MDFFDLRTAYLFMGLHYFTMPAMVWLALRHSRSPSVNAWCTGGVLFGLGLMLLSRRSEWPDWVTYELANVLATLGQLACVQALRLQLGRPLRQSQVLTLLASFFVLYELVRWADPSGKLAYLVGLGFMTAYFGWLGLLAWRLGRQKSLGSAYWLCAICMSMVLLATAHWLRVVFNLAPHGPLNPGTGSVNLLMMGNLVAMIGTISFMGFYVERAPPSEAQSGHKPVGTLPNAPLARQIAQLERERSMGMVTASVVHELSQPLTNIELIAEHAELDSQQRPEDSATVRAHLAQILLQSRHAAQVLQRVRHYIAPREARREPLELKSLNAQVLDLLADRLQSEGVALELDVCQDSVLVLGDETQLGLLLVNLYRHAIDASAGLSQRRIRVRIQTLGSRVQMQVENNGSGLSQQALEQAAQGRGLFGAQAADDLGVGLRMGSKIAAEHQGHLQLRTLAGGGLAELDLPRA